MMEITFPSFRFVSRSKKIDLNSVKDPLYIGVELEMRFCPNTTVLASLANLLECESVEDVRTTLRHNLEIPNWVERIYLDRLWDEIVLKPIEHRSYYNLKEEIVAYFNYLKKINAYIFDSDNFEELGIHHTLERNVLSPEQFTSLLEFIYSNRGIFLAISNRKKYSTKRADIEYLLGDREKRLSEESLREIFNREKRFLVESYRKGSEAEGLFIRLKKGNLFEFKQWGSTNDPEIFFNQIDFTAALISYIKNPSALNREDLVSTLTPFFDLGFLEGIPIFDTLKIANNDEPR